MERELEVTNHELADLQKHALKILSGHAGEIPPLVLRAVLLLILAITDWPKELGPPNLQQLKDIVEPTSVYLTERTALVCGQKNAEPVKES